MDYPIWDLAMHGGEPPFRLRSLGRAFDRAVLEPDSPGAERLVRAALAAHAIIALVAGLTGRRLGRRVLLLAARHLAPRRGRRARAAGAAARAPCVRHSR